MQKLTERVDELLGMLTIKADDIKEKVISIVKDAIPGAVNMEFRGIFPLSTANDLRACCKVVFMFLGKTFTIAFVGWSEPNICMRDSTASGNTATCNVSRMEDLPTIIACRLLHLDDKATENLDGRFMSDECEFGIGENGNGMLIMHGTYNSKEGNPMATLEFRVHGDDTEHADVRVYDGDTLIAEFNGIGVFHDHYDKEIDDAIEDYLKQGKEEPAETEPETPPVECKTWNEFWDYVYDENSEPQVILRNFANLISEYTDGEVCDDQMNRKVYFKYKGIDFAAHFESDDSFNIWYFQIEATDGVLDAGFHHFNRDDDFVKFMKNIVETRYHEPVKEPAKIGDALKTLESKVNGAPKTKPLTDLERIKRLEWIVGRIMDEIVKLRNR